MRSCAWMLMGCALQHLFHGRLCEVRSWAHRLGEGVRGWRDALLLLASPFVRAPCEFPLL